MKEAAFFGLDGLAEIVDANLKRVVVVVSFYSHNFHCSKKECNCGDGEADIDRIMEDDHDPFPVFVHPAPICCIIECSSEVDRRGKPPPLIYPSRAQTTTEIQDARKEKKIVAA